MGGKGKVWEERGKEGTGKEGRGREGKGGRGEEKGEEVRERGGEKAPLTQIHGSPELIIILSVK